MRPSTQQKQTQTPVSMHRIVVFSDGGIVLWDQQNTAEKVPNSILNEVIIRNFIEGSHITSIEGYTVRVARNHELGVNTAVISPSLAKMAHAETAANDVNTIFSTVNGDELRTNRMSNLPDNTNLHTDKFEALVAVRLEELGQIEDQHEEEEQEEEEETKEVGPTGPTEPKEQIKPKSKKAAVKKPKKKGRKWDGTEEFDGDEGTLDYSEPAGDASAATASLEKLSLDEYGTKSKHGFVVKELSNELSGILGQKQGSSKPAESFGFLRGLVGGKKLTDKDLDKALGAMEDHLVQKNVAKEVAGHICEQVRKDLLGSTTDSWTSVKATVHKSVTDTLTKILTPSTSVDLLLEVQRSRQQKGGRPYVISVVGVNGVGKSTNLGKIAFWLLQNNMKVLIAACDTFRSGAVEQLKVHVQRLKQLTERQNGGEIDIFDQGYGKDAAVIAQKAVEHGQRNGYDVVLIDTAGRRHNDERLMSSLEKFGKLAKPDKIIMVGEALVGTDSVQQARNFDAAFGKGRHLDFFLISKCDTVGDMLGTLVNMTYSTGVPVLFVGVGQNYTDLRTLSVDWAVNLLLN